MGSVVDRLRRIWWTVSDAVGDRWRTFRDASRRIQILSVLGVLLLIVVVAVIVVGAVGGNDTEENRLNQAVVTTGDLPANLWSGWTERKQQARPATATTEPGMSAKPAQCVPGGDLQRSVQGLAVDGGEWVGTDFTNIALRARAETMLVVSDRDVVAPVEQWVAACGAATVIGKDSSLQVTLKQLPVDPKVYGLAAARVVAQTVTPNVANADPDSTTLTAVGTTGTHIVYVTLTFPGATTNDAISTLDTLWRAQSAKLVAYQRSGNL
ncbi:hypothetical protein [Gordonia sihwensis]|uniref:hypothetical protein n=1 Tax=Gordonia sihwensis TaxID=173559 RepID=UPI0005F0BB6B|nr:hypothetical protein [Gordonia sihwensis]KJR10468.1 hypothetical protein UG54_00245 [Gordonia sihwensis]